MITIWGRATSANVQAVMWTAAELGLEVERIDWGGKHGGNDDPAFRGMSPAGLVPALRDGDLTLFESPAMVRYLAARYASDVFRPADPAAFAALDQWAEWAKSAFSGAVIGGLFTHLIRTKQADRDPAALVRAEAAAAACARTADARIGDGPWLGGDALTFADVMLGHFLYRYYTMDFARAETPALDAYYARLCARPAFAAHVMVSYDGLRAE
jgi:glutathione S-transferase